MTPNGSIFARWTKRLGQGVLAAIFIPLILALFFLMPADAVWSTWHLIAAQSTTTGVVMSSAEAVSHGRGGGTRSDIVYRYEAGGRVYEGSRVNPGFLHRGYEAGGGELARGLHPGDAITVHYSAWMPSLAFLRQGWPKWSIGFSLAVWGIVGVGVFCPETRKGERPFPLFWQALIKPMFFTGFVVVGLMDPVIAVTDMWIPLAFHGGASLALAGYWCIRYQPAYAGRQPGRWLRPKA